MSTAHPQGREQRPSLKDVFNDALALPVDQRAPFLDRACSHDTDLRARIENMLRLHDDAGPFLGSPTDGGAAGELGVSGSSALAGGSNGFAFPTSASHAGIERPGAQIGRYRLLDRIGEGGFGVVFTAEQSEPVRRIVALKIIKAGMDTREVLARFDVERQALALMDHPNVAKVFDAGQTEAQSAIDGGRPYFVMEYAAGSRITDYCDANRLRIRERLELFVKICQAVQHAHTKGIIHRDLKPSNILVTLVDGRPMPKVIDFGIAKATAAPLTDRSLQTVAGRLMGTPEYMSPEQAGTSGIDVDTRGDVYSLGVIMYQLLTGTLPFDPQTLREVDFATMVKLIREAEPPKPSARLSTLGAASLNQHGGVTPLEIATRRDAEFSSLQRQVRGELDWIVMKCLEKDRARRYETANALAMDVARYLAHEPVAAGPPSAGYKLRKFVRRNQGSVIAAGLLGLTLLLGLAGTLWQAQRAAERAQAAERAEAEQRRLTELEVKARTRAEAINKFVKAALISSDPNWGGRQDTLVADAMMKALTEINNGTFKDDPQTEASLLDTIALVLYGNGRVAEAEPLFARSLETYRRIFNTDHPAVAASLTNLANVLQALGRTPEAEPLYQQALETYQRLHEGDHAEVAIGMSNVASAWQTLGRATEAERLLETALEMRRRLFQGDHADIAMNLNNLAVVRESLGRAVDAEPLYVEALDMRRRLFTGDHPDVASSLNNLGYVRQTLGRTAEAEPLYVQALEMQQRLFKGDHPDVAGSLNNLAFVRSSLGRAAEAESLYVQALEMNQRLFKGDHPQIAANLNGLAYVRGALGRTAEAEPLLAQALAMKQRLFKGDHPDVALSLNNLAAARSSLGQPEEAETLYVQALEMRQRLFKGDHPDVAQALHNVAAMRKSLGRAAEAEPLFVQAMEMIQRVYKSDHPNIVKCMISLAECMETRGRTTEALAQLREALAMQRRLLPPESPDLASTLGLFGLALVNAGTPEAAAEAEPILRECLAIREKAYPDGHPRQWWRFQAMSALGGALMGQSKFAEAEPLLLDSYNRMKDDAQVQLSSRATDRKREALERIVRFYSAWDRAEPEKGYDAQAAKWRAEYSAWQASTQPAAPGP